MIGPTMFCQHPMDIPANQLNPFLENHYLLKSISFVYPFVSSDCQLNLRIYSSLAAFDVEVDGRMKFSDLLLAVATVYWIVTTAPQQSELQKRCS